MNRIHQIFLQNRKKLYINIVIATLLMLLAVYLMESEVAGILPGMILVFVSLGLSVWGVHKFWRCPSCQKHLGKLYIGLDHPKYCPECGIELIDND